MIRTVGELHLNFVRCRTMGHAWDEFPAALFARKPTVFSWQEAFRCTRCATEKYESYSLQGQVAQRQYVYPDGYKLAEKLTRAEFRLELRMRRRRMVRKKKGA